ncbi:MAG: hypothetical protein OXD42_06100 [Rhodospirillaceae bacterium]|nr:hypothetical protein [Rhodospirillaceae bacterium]
MAWSEATRAQYGRPHDDRQDDLTDAEWALTAPLIPTQGRMGDVQGGPDVMVDLPDKAWGVSKVFADGETGGDTLRDWLKEVKVPDIPEIVGKP